MIDVHAHVGVPAALDRVSTATGFATFTAATAARYRDPVTADYMKAVAPEWDRLLTDTDARLAQMDTAGVQMQILSVNPGQYYYWADAADAVQLVQLVNRQLAAMVREHPSRFLALGTVALQHPTLAVSQLDEAINEHRFVGVQISSHAGGADLSNPELEPFWSVAERHDAVIFVHPLGCPQLTDRLAPSYLNNVIGQPLETTIALSHLIFTGVLDRHPRLRIVAAHGGGFLPYYLGRSQHAYDVRPDSHSMAEPPEAYLKRMWFDSVVHSPAIARTLIDTVGLERVVVGSDYPFDMGTDHPGDLIDSIPGLTEQERTAIRTDNVHAMLGRHADRLPMPTHTH